MLIAHLSDPHLRTDVLAARPAQRLHDALGRVLGIEPRPDAIVVTGDLAEHGHTGAYAHLAELLADIPVPVHLAAGNHDDRGALLATFAGTTHLAGGSATTYAVEHREATILVLDSHGAGQLAGHLGAEQLVWLDAHLAARPHLPAFVALHHPPVAVGIPFLDARGLDDAAALAEIITAHAHVARVLAGHVHRHVVAAFAGTIVTTAPSTDYTSELALRADRAMGHLDEPTSVLLHQIGQDTSGVCVTHTAPVSYAGALRHAALP